MWYKNIETPIPFLIVFRYDCDRLVKLDRDPIINQNMTIKHIKESTMSYSKKTDSIYNTSTTFTPFKPSSVTFFGGNNTPLTTYPSNTAQSYHNTATDRFAPTTVRDSSVQMFSKLNGLNACDDAYYKEYVNEFKSNF